MNSTLMLVLIAGAAVYFWPQIHAAITGTSTGASATPPLLPPSTPTADGGPVTTRACPTGFYMSPSGLPGCIGSPPGVMMSPGFISTLPQPGQYGIPSVSTSQTVVPGSLQVVNPTSPVIVTAPPVVIPPPAQSGPSLSAAYASLQQNVIPPTISDPLHPGSAVTGLTAAEWNSYLHYLTGVNPPDASLFNSQQIYPLDLYWSIAMPALQGQGMSGLAGWYA